MPRSTIGRVAALGTAILTASCAAPRSESGRLEIPFGIPAGWTSRGGEPVVGSVGMPEAAVSGWINDLAPASVRAAVREALAANNDLRAAAARLRGAGARRRIAESELYPTLGAEFDAARSERQLGGESGSARGDSFDLALAAAWEFDLWGRLRDTARSAALELDASQADFQAARFSLAAGTARAWYDATAAQAQLDLALRTRDSFRSLADVLQSSYWRGLPNVGALDVQLALSNASAAEAGVRNRTRDLDATIRRLETLLGRYPSRGLEVGHQLPPPSSGVPAGLPSDLLLRRPDIAAAETRVAASMQRVSAARKNLLPSIRLTGRGGRSTSDLSRLLDQDELVWNIAAGITAPVFEGGRRRAEVARAEAERDELAAEYAQAALTAFREVEVALAAESLLAGRVTALENASREASEAERLALQQYGRGLVEIVTVLESQRRAFDARSTLIVAQNERLQNRLDLYLALGGDFETPPSEPPQSGPRS